MASVMRGVRAVASAPSGDQADRSRGPAQPASSSLRSRGPAHVSAEADPAGHVDDFLSSLASEREGTDGGPGGAEATPKEAGPPAFSDIAKGAAIQVLEEHQTAAVKMTGSVLRSAHARREAGGASTGTTEAGVRASCHRLLHGKGASRNQVHQAASKARRTPLQDQADERLCTEHTNGVYTLSDVQTQVMQHRALLRRMWLRPAAAAADIEQRITARHDIFTGTFYTLFFLLFFWVISAQTAVYEKYQLESAMREYIRDTPAQLGGSGSQGTAMNIAKPLHFDDIASLEDVWNWLEGSFVNSVFPEQRSRAVGEKFSAEEIGYLLQYNKVVGGFELVQRRVVEVCVPPLTPISSAMS